MSEKHVLNLKFFKWIFKYPNNYLESQLEKNCFGIYEFEIKS